MIAHRRFRAPRAHGTVLAEPPLDQIGSLLTPCNFEIDLPLLRRNLAELRAQARREALHAAREYLLDKGEVPPEAEPSAPLIMAGHQPELFHPGVWAKNFALYQLARRHGATPLHVIVDNDTIKGTAMRLPAWNGASPHTEDAEPHLASLAYDTWTGEIPFEERGVADEELFATFPERLKASTGNWGYRPLGLELWERMSRDPRLDERVSAARRSLERAWGCCNLEVPMSRLSDGDSFAAFVVLILGEMERFHETYNASVGAYRSAHGLRSRSHPVPDLVRDGDWWELPFWGWRSGESRRGRLFACRARGTVALRVETQAWGEVAAKEHGVSEFKTLLGRPFKLRTRALSTTLFARMFLADLFLHGIGGGKYDEVTDDLMRRHFGLEPPPVVVLSASLLLPFALSDPGGSEGEEAERLRRDVYWNPQRHLGTTTGKEPRLLADEKQAWIDHVTGTRRERRERFHALREVTDKLRRFTEKLGGDLELRVATWRRRQEVRELLGRRDYSLCLYPEEELRPYFARILER